MKIQIIGSSTGASGPRQFLSSILINETVVIDAGSIGFMLPIEAQTKVQHVFLSHSHLDHIASLPILLDNRAARQSSPIDLYSSQRVLESLRNHFFNNEIWPDVEMIKPGGQAGFRSRIIAPRVAVEVAGLHITPIELNHVIPTFGFIAADDQATVAFISDTAQTDEIWQTLDQVENLKAVFVECAFPNSQRELADVSKHLTPEILRGELEKLSRPTRIIVVHMKPAFHETIAEELASLQIKNLEIGISGRSFEF